MFNEITKELMLGEHKLTISTGKVARQTDGAVIVRMGDTVVLVTVCIDKNAIEGRFLPLTVDYREMFFAAGKIPGGFVKREGKASNQEILISRLIDRSLRPLFPENFYNPIHIVCTVLSYDPEHMPDVLAMIGASAALSISGMPISSIAAAKIGYIDSQFVLNPNNSQLKNSQLSLTVAGDINSIIMVESESHQLSEKQLLDAIKYGHQAFQPIIQIIEELKTAVNKPLMEIPANIHTSMVAEIIKEFGNKIKTIFSELQKQKRYQDFVELRATIINHFTGSTENLAPTKGLLQAIEEAESQILRQQIFEQKKRIDGRSLDEIRPIACEANWLPRVHGSALFTRGETQSIATVTLGTLTDQQIIDNLEAGEQREHFMLHYIFPPYSVGEAGALKGPGRREIGHGRLAWHAINPVMPNRDSFPYTIRVVSEISESNGSSSMATVCGASLALMDAGVPITAPVAGIAMGLIKREDDFLILSDILGDEDHLGDMDFKVAGTTNGVTALQMDIKIRGLSFEIIEQALAKAKDGRLHILAIMEQVASTHKKTLSNYAPVIHKMRIEKDKIRELIGPSGKVIRNICEVTKAKIDISDDGVIQIAAPNQGSLDQVISMVNLSTREPKIGEKITGKVVKIVEFGAFINYAGSKDGFLHISEISDSRVNNINEHLGIDQTITAYIIGIDRATGKAKLSMKNKDGSNAPERKERKTHAKNKETSELAAVASAVTERKYFN